MTRAATRSSPMRERFREQVREDVKEAALEQLAQGGAPAISVNAIAKQLGVSGPSLYRYFANRDELLSALIIDAYTDFRDALAGATTSAPDRQPAERLRALARAYRSWALDQPHRYELLFKPPLPGYDAHAEPLASAARSLMAVALGAVRDLRPGGAAPAGDLGPAIRRHQDVLAAREAGSTEFRHALSVWTRLHGIVSLEIGGGFSAMLLDADALFEAEVDALLSGMTPTTAGHDRGR